MNNNVVHVVLNEFTNDSRVMRECKSLAKEGYSVTVIALWNSGLAQNEYSFGYNIVRIPLFSRRLSKNPFIQIIKYIEFLIKAQRIIKKIKPSICHGHDPNGLVIAYISKLIFKSKLIYDSHELWSDCIHMYGRKKIIFKIGRVVEKILIYFADYVITVNKSIADIMLRENKIKKIEIIQNMPEKNTNKKKYSKEKLGFPSCEFNIIYVGNIENGRGIEAIINAFSLVNNNIGFIIMGRDGLYKNKMIDLVQHKQLKNRIKFINTVKPDHVISICTMANIGISPIQNLCRSYYFCLPNKIFEYIQAHLPVISSNFPEMKNIIEKYDLGLTFDIDSIGNIADTINRIYNDSVLYGKFSLNSKIASEGLIWKNEESKLFNLYSRI